MAITLQQRDPIPRQEISGGGPERIVTTAGGTLEAKERGEVDAVAKRNGQSIARFADGEKGGVYFHYEDGTQVLLAEAEGVARAGNCAAALVNIRFVANVPIPPEPEPEA